MLKYDVEKLKELLKSFYIATDRGISIFSENYQKLATYPEQHAPFCEMIRTNPDAEFKCEDEARAASEICKQLKKPYTYTCHIGLSETIVPILHDNLIIGYLMVGQIVNENKDKLWLRIEENCRPYGYDMDELRASLSKMSVVGKDRIMACTKLIETCAVYVWLAQLASFTQNNISQQLEEFINANLSEDLSTDNLCDKFKISRSTLYMISKHFFGNGIHEFISARRIETAKKLLTETNIPIKDIAEKVGISSNNYFTNLFKKTVGVTPNEFRHNACYWKL